MKNFIQNGDNLTIASPAAVASGAGVMVGSLFGVANGAALTGEPVTISRKGVFGSVPKVTGTAFAIGDPLYWDDGNSRVTTTVGSNLLVGVAVEIAATADTTCVVLLDGATR